MDGSFLTTLAAREAMDRERRQGKCAVDAYDLGVDGGRALRRLRNGRRPCTR